MSATENEHDWFKEQVAAYLAGALVGAERERFELHARACEACASDLDAARKLEGAMTTLFASTIPNDLEDRLIGRLRFSSQMRMPHVHPLVRKTAVAAAAAVVLGALGYVGKEYVETGTLPTIAFRSGAPQTAAQLGPTTGPVAIDNIRAFVATHAPLVITRAGSDGIADHWMTGATTADVIYPGDAVTFDTTGGGGTVIVAGASPVRATGKGMLRLGGNDSSLGGVLGTDGTTQIVGGLNGVAIGMGANGPASRNQETGGGSITTFAGGGTLNVLAGKLPSGSITVAVGELNVNQVASGPQKENRQLTMGGGTLSAGTLTSTIILNGRTPPPAAPTANVMVNSGTLNLSDRSGGGITVNGAGVPTISTQPVVNGAVNGKGAITKAGKGELKLADANTYAGGTNITGGTLAFADDSLDRDLLTGTRGGGGGGGGRGGMARGPYFRPGDANSTALTSPNSVMPSENDAEPRLQVANNGSLAIQGDLSKAKSLDAKEEQAGKDDKARSAQAAAANPMLAINQVDVPANNLAPTTAPAGTFAPVIRKVIREGVMEFEVDSFDSAFSTITKVTAEESGFVAAADSDKLPNGKVRGTITVRVPPDNLDRLVLKLRSLGELKSQRLGSRDVGKEYTDLESELRAARAMEERLIGMIKSAQGKVADLLAAEKELGSWRTKIEKIQGELNYYNNLVSMATLSITAYEKDIRTPASASQTEEINAGVETDDVEASRAAAIKSIDDAKGRIVESSLQKMDAGKFAARIVAEIPAENAGPLVDRLKQLGRVARLDIQRKQTPDNPKSPGVAPLKVEQTPTRLILSLVSTPSAARQSEEINAGIETDDVEASRNAALKSIDDAKGRIIDSTLQKLEAGQFAAQIIAEVPQENAGPLVDRLRQLGRVARLDIQRKQTDAGKPQADATPLKIDQGPTRFVVSMYNLANVAPRLTTNLNLAGDDVEKIYRAILKRIGDAQGRVVTSNLNHQDATQVIGSIQFDVKAADADAVLNDMRKDVQVLRMSVNENPDTANVTTAKQAFTVQIIPTSLVSPREMRTLAVQTDQVESAMQSVASAVNAAGGKMVESSMTQEPDGRSSARIGIELPLAKADQLVDAIRKLGQVRTAEASKNPLVPDGAMARARINVMIGSSQSIVTGGHGLWDSIRNGLSTSVQGLLWSLELIVIGLCLIGPWLLMVWGGWKLARRRKATAP